MINREGAQKVLFDLTRRKVLQYIRFKPFEKNTRDPKAFFRLRSNASLPSGAIEQIDLDQEETE